MQATPNARATGAAVLSMAACAAMLVTSEVMLGVLLLQSTGIGGSLSDFLTDIGSIGKITTLALLISGIFAVAASLSISTLGSAWDRKYVLIGICAALVVSSTLTLTASGLDMLIAGQIILGLAVGAFWSLSTAMIMQLVAVQNVPRAVSVLFLGQALAAAFSFQFCTMVSALFGWRVVYLGFIAISLAIMLLQARALPSISARKWKNSFTFESLLGRPYVLRGLIGSSVTWIAFLVLLSNPAPFFEQVMEENDGRVSFSAMLTLAGFSYLFGTWMGWRLADRFAERALALPAFSITLLPFGLFAFGHNAYAVTVMLVVSGAMKMGMSVMWSVWLAHNIDDQPEVGGSLMFAAVQLSILVGGFLGVALLTSSGIAANYLVAACFGAIGVLVVGSGRKLKKP